MMKPLGQNEIYDAKTTYLAQGLGQVNKLDATAGVEMQQSPTPIPLPQPGEELK